MKIFVVLCFGINIDIGIFILCIILRREEIILFKVEIIMVVFLFLFLFLSVSIVIYKELNFEILLDIENLLNFVNGVSLIDK